MRRGGVVRIGLLVSLLTIFVPSAWGSTGGVTNVGGFSFGSEHFTGVREWVELKGRGGLLQGSLSHGLLKFMTVYAPGTTSGHLIFRELKTFDGRVSFLLTAPDDLVDRIKRVTLFLQSQTSVLELYEQVEGQWIQHLPQSLRVADGKGPEGQSENVVAFSVKNPGFFWVRESSHQPSITAAFVPQDPSAKSLMGGSVLLGLSTLIASILLLSIGWLVSRRLHSLDPFVRK